MTKVYSLSVYKETKDVKEAVVDNDDCFDDNSYAKIDLTDMSWATLISENYKKMNKKEKKKHLKKVDKLAKSWIRLLKKIPEET